MLTVCCNRWYECSECHDEDLDNNNNNNNNNNNRNDKSVRRKSKL